MTNAELIAIGKARHGDQWKEGLSTDTGWSWWTFYRIERDQQPVSDKLAKAAANLPRRT
jgi:hypothetical protein